MILPSPSRLHNSAPLLPLAVTAQTCGVKYGAALRPRGPLQNKRTPGKNCRRRREVNRAPPLLIEKVKGGDGVRMLLLRKRCEPGDEWQPLRRVNERAGEQGGFWTRGVNPLCV
ncbi:hypothetical protein JOB18_006781 [Solea senegalensis]|uniref:Uncharacterized protein n=1 Tax=Solea senegalensis TaxID=28829 RepID=A0AAV6PM34_SOLSE|nr:hypothetical protein JOB18_006781 [Solea senegalensis]